MTTRLEAIRAELNGSDWLWYAHANLLLAAAEAAAAFFRDDYLDLCSAAGGTTESLEELRAAIAPLLEEAE